MPIAPPRFRVLPLVTVCLAGLALCGTAVGHEADLQDGDDVRGLLDIESVRLDHKRAELTFTLEAYGRFTRRDIRHRVGNIRIWFFVDGDRKPDYELLATADDRGERIFVNVGRAGAGPGTIPTLIRALRPNASSIRFVVPTRLIGRPQKFRWQAETEYHRSRDEAPRRPTAHTLG